MAYLETWNLYHNSSNLFVRTAVACARAAQDILNEDPATANHANRIIWAQTALGDAESMARRLMWAIAGNATIASTGEACADSDIQFVVNSNIDLFAKGV